MSGKETLTDENISRVLGPDNWVRLQGTARSLRNAGDGSRLITQAEVDIFVGSVIIHAADEQLNSLKIRFPDERFKDPSKQDPCFRDERDLLLGLRREFSYGQKKIRSDVRRYHQRNLAKTNTSQRLHI